MLRRISTPHPELDRAWRDPPRCGTVKRAIPGAKFPSHQQTPGSLVQRFPARALIRSLYSLTSERVPAREVAADNGTQRAPDLEGVRRPQTNADERDVGPMEVTVIRL